MVTIFTGLDDIPAIDMIMLTSVTMQELAHQHAVLCPRQLKYIAEMGSTYMYFIPQRR